MAERILNAQGPGARTLVIAGNAHTALTPTMLGVPLGARLAEWRPGVREIRIRYGNGTYYNLIPQRFKRPVVAAPPGPAARRGRRAGARPAAPVQAWVPHRMAADQPPAKPSPAGYTGAFPAHRDPPRLPPPEPAAEPGYPDFPGYPRQAVPPCPRVRRRRRPPRRFRAAPAPSGQRQGRPNPYETGLTRGSVVSMTAEVFPGGGLFQRGASAFAASVPVDPADDGFFGPGSVTWRLHADLSAPVSGLRSLLLQALHPLAMAGVDQHSQWRDDPAGRFASTAAYVLTTTYGDRAAARAAADRVRKIHEWVRGTDPVTGRPYAAGDPDLLIWVHAAQVDSGLAAAERYGAEFSDADRDGYVAEMTAAAELVGVPPGRAPASVAELDAYFDRRATRADAQPGRRRHRRAT